MTPNESKHLTLVGSAPGYAQYWSLKGGNLRSLDKWKKLLCPLVLNNIMTNFAMRVSLSYVLRDAIIAVPTRYKRKYSTLCIFSVICLCWQLIYFSSTMAKFWGTIKKGHLLAFVYTSSQWNRCKLSWVCYGSMMQEQNLIVSFLWPMSASLTLSNFIH